MTHRKLVVDEFATKEALLPKKLTFTYRFTFQLLIILPLPILLASQEKIETQNLETNDGDVWRLGWNFTGTVLATSGENGAVSMWKSDFTGTFVSLHGGGEAAIAMK